MVRTTLLASLVLAPLLAYSACTPNTASTADLQSALQQGGVGYTLQLCQSQVYNLTDVLNYTAAYQEISTEGYPTDDRRATLLIGGFNKTSAVQASDANLSYVKLRNIQINGNRGDSPIYTAPNANIEFGGANQGQLVEYVKTYDPRGWSCLHIAEGPFECSNVTIQNNDIGPCGSQSFQQWADGISLSCHSSLVQNNVIVDATDGGIVVFGAPYSTIRNNTISVQTRTMLGGINMVDVLPWLPEGNFSNTIVEGNFINGGFATDTGNATLGKQNASAIIKIGIAVGPDIWFSDLRYGTNQSNGGVIRDNVFSGAFDFAMGVAGTRNFVIENNSFTGNLSFIGSYGPNCTTGAQTPHAPVPLLQEASRNDNLTLSVPSPSAEIAAAHPGAAAFVDGTPLGLTCFLPPSSDTIAWPYKTVEDATGTSSSNSSGTGTSGGNGGSQTSSPATTSAGSAGRGVQLGMSMSGSGLVVGVAAALIGAGVVLL